MLFEREVVVEGGHSTCTASKAMIYGASKSATLVVVKMPNLDEGSIVEVLVTINVDIQTKNRGGRSVISISWVSNIPAVPIYIPIPYPWSIIRQDTMNLEHRWGTRVVCAAGNEAEEVNPSGQKRLLIDTYAAAFIYSQSNIQGLGVAPVSNCDIHGREAPSSQKALHQPLFAPGVDIKCAVSTAEKGFRVETGTSFCESSLKLLSRVHTIRVSEGEFFQC